jgi:radical SAM protein with 4Fe4S-binding SPASM domain
MITLQIHLTSSCNKHCLHCYGNFPSSPPTNIPTLTARGAIDEYLALSKEKGFKQVISITGGEPLLHPEAEEIIKYAAESADTVILMTNGSHLNKNLRYLLSSYSSIVYQLSLDGMKLNHDKIRGEGDFQRTIHLINELNSAGATVYISTTVNRLNIHDIPAILSFCHNNDLIPILHRYIPTGRGKDILALSRNEIMSLYQYVSTNVSTYHIAPHCTMCSIVAIKNDNEIRECNIGTHCIVIDENGSILACPYINEKLGTIGKDSLKEIWDYSPILKKFRERKFGTWCAMCAYNQICGGCRAISLAYSGDLFGDETLCPLYPSNWKELINPLRIFKWAEKNYSLLQK